MTRNELTLGDIQKESLRLLSIIDEFCKLQNIDYSLGYGALIGAIRHQGFIPWDDDIDIIMTRANYDKLLKRLVKSNITQDTGIKLYAPELGNSFCGISRICDMQRTYVRKYYQWADDETGLWIDVFPIDSLPEDFGEALRNQSQRCFDVCGASVPFSKDFSFERHLKIIGKKFLYRMTNRKREINEYLSQLARIPVYGSTEYVCNISSPYKKKDIHKKELFDNYIRKPFESIEVSVIRDYDIYLKSIYGDYMKMPPEKDRVRGHSDNKYYWK